MQPSSLHPSMSPRQKDLLFYFSLLVLVGVCFCVAVLGGRRLLISGHMWPPDVLFGFDIARNIENLTQPGVNYRNNVHPLFAPVFKPFALLIQKTGVTPGISAIILNAAAAAAGALILAWYFRLRAVGRRETLLATALTLGTTTWAIVSAIPGTYMFSFCMIGLSQVLLVWTLTHPPHTLTRAMRCVREGLWLAVGILNYGITVTNGFISFLIYGCAGEGKKAWVRACVYGALVLVLGLALSAAVGSSLDLMLEKRWLVGEELHGPGIAHPVMHSTATNLVWGFVAPIPTLERSLDARQWVLATFFKWQYTPAGWVACTGWIALLIAALACLARERSRREIQCALALALPLTFHICLHMVYYMSSEGVFAWTPHSLFLVMGLFVPFFKKMRSLSPQIRWGLTVLIALLALLMLGRHVALLWELRDMVPLPLDTGYSTH